VKQFVVPGGRALREFLPDHDQPVGGGPAERLVREFHGLQARRERTKGHAVDRDLERVRDAGGDDVGQRRGFQSREERVVNEAALGPDEAGPEMAGQRARTSARNTLAPWAAQVLAVIVTHEEVGEEHITPSMFGSRVVPAVAAANSEAAVRMGVARRRPRAG
jgi:hypothetical protein